MKKTLLSSLVLASSLALTSVVQAFEIQHSEGVLQLDKAPAKVVSYELSHLDTLTALGIKAAGVPRSTYEGYLAEYKSSPLVGTLFEPDYDALKELNPDLVMAGGRSLPVMGDLNKVAPTITFDYDAGDFLNSVKGSVRSMAKAWNKESKAEDLIKNLETNVSQLHEMNQGQTGVLLFIVNDFVIAHAPKDRFGYLEELTGLQPILPPRTPEELAQPRPKPNTPEAAAAAKKRALELDKIAQANPDWIFVIDRGAINNAEKTAHIKVAEHPILSQLDAVKNNKVIYVEPNPWYIITAGITNLTNITEQLIKDMAR